MSKDVKDIKPMVISGFNKTISHWPAIAFVVVATIYGILILQINLLNHEQPDESAVQQQVSAFQRPSIDDKTAQKLMDLQDNNQQTKALFKTSRDNPFSE